MARFWFHYNKPASRKAGVPQMTVHSQGICFVVRRIECRVPVQTRERKTQPHVVMVGTGSVHVSGDACIIS